MDTTDLTLEEMQKRLEQIYNQARMLGLCKTQKEFAKFLRIGESAMSSAMNGDEKYLTNNFFARIENAFNEAGISLDGATIMGSVNNQQGNGNTNAQTATKEPLIPTVERLLDEMKAQREMYDRQMSELLKQYAQLVNIITNQKQ